MKRKTNEEYIKECKENDYDLSIEKYINNQTKIKHKCSKCGNIYKQAPSNHLRGQGCPYCRGTHKKSTKEYIKECKTKGLDLPIESYVNAKTKIKHKCKQGHVYEQKPNDHLSGYRCPSCYGTPKKATQDYVKDCKIKGYDLPIEEYIDNSTPIKHKCSKCGGIYLQRPLSHLHGQGCPKCGIKKVKKKLRKSFKQYYNECLEKRYDLPIKNENYINNITPIRHKCTYCNYIYKQTPGNHLQGHGCPYCSQNKGEKFIQNYLDNHSISYIMQKKFTNLKDKRPLSYDFYLPKQNVLIEYQGIQHFVAGGKGRFNKDYFNIQQYHDKLKHDYAINNGYILLEPTYKINTQEKVNKYLDRYLLKTLDK